jgi:hypothetical protein
MQEIRVADAAEPTEIKRFIFIRNGLIAKRRSASVTCPQQGLHDRCMATVRKAQEDQGIAAGFEPPLKTPGGSQHLNNK